MSALQELTSLISGGARAIVIAEKDIDLRSEAPDNKLFVLKIAEGSLAAGGRGGGFGERRVVRVVCYQRKTGEWSKTLDIKDEVKAGEYEVPYYVSRLPFALPDGSEGVGYGVVEADLVGQMTRKSGIVP